MMRPATVGAPGEAPMKTELAPPSLEQQQTGTDKDAMKRRAEARIGAVLRGKWRIDRLIGVGGMAAVYEGTHRNGKRGAIKLLHLELSMDQEARARFLQEGQVANKVAHPGAVIVLDDDTAEDGAVFLVMELLEGKSVSSIAETRPHNRLRVGESLRLFDQLLDVLVAAHDKGVVHRDIKPENLFLTNDGTLKVLDFGLARVMETKGGANMTRMGNAMGTPAFMPPEQALGEWDKVDAQSDLWATGASLFTLITGRLVHEAPTLNQLLLKAMTHPAPPIRSILPALPSDVAEVVDRALAFKKEERWPNAAAMQRAVRKAIATIESKGEPLLEPPPPSSRKLGADDSAMPTLVRDPTGVRTTGRGARRGLLVGGLVLLLVGVVVGVASLVRSGASASDGPQASALPASPAAPVPTASATATPSATSSPTTDARPAAAAVPASATASAATPRAGAPRRTPATTKKVEPNLTKWE
jgi:serine/threonine-protein kinase